MSTVTTISGFPTTTEGAELLGEVVSWFLPPRARVPFSALRGALEHAGLDAKVARKCQPRNAFSRAARMLAVQKIIRKVSEDHGTLTFQLTAEHNDGTQLSYSREAMIALDKETGAITCDHPE